MAVAKLLRISVDPFLLNNWLDLEQSKFARGTDRAMHSYPVPCATLKFPHLWTSKFPHPLEGVRANGETAGGLAPA
jgi:hypothetical protein